MDLFTAVGKTYRSKTYRSLQKYFLDLGIKTIRFWNNEVNINIEGVINKVLSELEKEPHPSPLLKGEGAIR